MEQNDMVLESGDPEDYVPYSSIELCGNNLENVRYIFDINGFHPLLIGKGVPYVWLSAPSSPNSQQWIPLVQRTISVNRSITIKKENNNLSIFALSKKIIEITQISDTKARVLYIDFRRIGLNIFGDETVLHVGNTNFSGNTIENGHVFMVLGHSQKPTPEKLRPSMGGP